MVIGRWYKLAGLLILTVITLCLYHQFRIVIEPRNQLRPLATNPSPQHNGPAEMMHNHNQMIKNSRREIVPDKDVPDWKPLGKDDRDDIKIFLIFIGWPRSCHSIIGSMLDAHPNVIVAHEYYLFSKLKENRELRKRQLLFDQLYKNSYMSAMNGWRTTNQSDKGYNLNIENSWQGRFTTLRVIGDKCGGDATRMYHKSKREFTYFYNTLNTTVKVPIKVLQVVRNPFDMAATTALYRGSSNRNIKLNATRTNRFDDQHILRSAMISVLQLADAIVRMIPDVGLSPLEIHCEDLVNDPVKTISRICEYLDLECSQDYLQMCADKTFKNVSESRHLVHWNPNTLSVLMRNMKKYPFFDRYNF